MLARYCTHDFELPVVADLPQGHYASVGNAHRRIRDNGLRAHVRHGAKALAIGAVNTQTGTNTTTHTGSESVTYNTTDKDTGTVTDQDNGTDTHTRNYQLTRTGNIGTMTSQQMLESERNLYMLWQFFYDVVFPDVDRVLTLSVYKRV